MSRYNQQYGSSYYDPLGNQTSQPTGYTYEGPATHSTYQNHPNVSGHGGFNYQNYSSNSYDARQYELSAQQPGRSTSNAAAALSSLSGGQNYGSTGNTSSAININRSGSNASNAYNSVTGRTGQNESSTYSSSQSSSTFGRVARPGTQESPSTFGASQPSYTNAPSNASTQSSSYPPAHHQSQHQPSRYSSPLHAVQAQHTQRQPQATHQLSPQLSNASHHNRQHSASIEPSPTTVDPSQVYDNRAELQRKAQTEAERRRKHETELAAMKAQEERDYAEQENKKAEEEIAKKAAEQKRKNEQRRKAREEKKQSKNAASALQRLASGTAEAPDEPPADDEEAQMRAMFKKMREFNAKNPAMLAKLWEEERQSHEASRNTPAPTPASAAPAVKTGIAASPPTQKVQTVEPKAAPKRRAVPPAVTPTPMQQSSSQQARSLPPSGSSSLWPPHKKGALAEVTARWLMALPQNAGISIQPEQVRQILDTNPSYVQLCESIESLDMHFDRSALARELLKAVPDGMKQQSARSPSVSRAGTFASESGVPPPPSPNSSNMGKKRSSNTFDGIPTAGTSTVQYEAPSSSVTAAIQVGDMGHQSFQPINKHGNTPLHQPHQSPYFVTAPTSLNRSRAPSFVAPPADVKHKVKEDEPLRAPADKEEAARKHAFGDLVDLTQDDSDDEGPPLKKFAGPSARSVPPNVVQQHPSSAKYLAKPIFFDQFMLHGHSRAESAFMSARHPEQQQINGESRNTHTSAPPTQTVPAPAPVPLKSTGPTAEQVQMSRLRGKLLVEPIMRDRVKRRSTYDSRTIARDVLLATGRHPDMRGLNGHLSVMQKLLGQHGLDSDGGNRSDLATIRWDMIDPEPPRSDNKEQEAEDVNEANAEAAIQPNGDHVRVQTPDSLPAKKKSGRPRKYTPPPARLIKRPDLGDSNASSPGPATPSSAPQPNHPDPAMAAPIPSSNVVGYNAFNQLGADGKKKKGRPFGWRKDIHSRAAQGLPSGSHPSKKITTTSSSPAPLGRPPKHVSEPVVPKYQTFACGWADCKSSLHNLETLTKHLVKVHGRPEPEQGQLVCRWQGCPDSTTRREAGFEAIEPWLAHVDEAHLRPIRWSLGDGPTVVGE